MSDILNVIWWALDAFKCVTSPKINIAQGL